MEIPLEIALLEKYYIAVCDIELPSDLMDNDNDTFITLTNDKASHSTNATNTIDIIITEQCVGSQFNVKILLRSTVECSDTGLMVRSHTRCSRLKIPYFTT